METWEAQQQRRAAERYYGPWERTRQAILEARGAAECADVGFEQKLRAMDEQRRNEEAEAWKGAKQAPPEAAIAATGAPFDLLDWLHERIYGPKVDYEGTDYLP